MSANSTEVWVRIKTRKPRNAQTKLNVGCMHRTWHLFSYFIFNSFPSFLLLTLLHLAQSSFHPHRTPTLSCPFLALALALACHHINLSIKLSNGASNNKERKEATPNQAQINSLVIIHHCTCLFFIHFPPLFFFFFFLDERFTKRTQHTTRCSQRPKRPKQTASRYARLKQGLFFFFFPFPFFLSSFLALALSYEYVPVSRIS